MKLLALLLLVGVAQAQGITKYAPGQKTTQKQTRTNWAPQSNSLTTGSAATSPWSGASLTMATVAGAPRLWGAGRWAN